MFYLTTHSTHFIYGYMASDIWLRTILIVRKETRCRHIGYFYRLTARVLLYAPSHRQDNTYHVLWYTSRGALAGTRNSSMGSPHEGSIRRPTAPWANALPLSYVPLPTYQKYVQTLSWVSGNFSEQIVRTAVNSQTTKVSYDRLRRKTPVGERSGPVKCQRLPVLSDRPHPERKEKKKIYIYVRLTDVGGVQSHTTGAHIKWNFWFREPVLHDWYNKGRGIRYPVCGMVHMCVCMCVYVCIDVWLHLCIVCMSGLTIHT